MANITMAIISVYIMISRTDIQIARVFPFNYIRKFSVWMGLKFDLVFGKIRGFIGKFRKKEKDK
jgi:hypothetical protein